MFARVTQFDIDIVSINLDEALNRFTELVLPELRRQPGYRGVSVMRNDQGRGLLITYWDTADAARAGVESGFYAEQIKKFLTFYRQAPGREHYEVVCMDEPVAAEVQ